ncbi:DnaJ domain-containing protein [bacterium]|nr:DnaJ domain-containing protein [bacterium]
MADFKKINRARELLKLPERATLKEIKDAYRTLSLKYHPDRVKGKKNKEKYSRIFNEITEAYNLLLSYCRNYPFSFKEKDVKKVIIDDKELIERFHDDWWEKL